MLKVTAYKKGKPCSVGGVLFKEYKKGWCYAEMFQHNYRYLRLTQKLFTKEEADGESGEAVKVPKPEPEVVKTPEPEKVEVIKEPEEVKTPEAPKPKPKTAKKVESLEPVKPKRKRRTNKEIEADKAKETLKVESTEEAEKFSGFTSDSGEG